MPHGLNVSHACLIRILSETDGKKSPFSAAGSLERTPRGARLRYRMNGSLVTLETDGGSVSMCREGDVYLRFTFCGGTETEGEIGLSPAEAGRVRVFSPRVESVLSEKDGEIEKLAIILEYVLSFSAREEQRVRLRLIAERKKS